MSDVHHTDTAMVEALQRVLRSHERRHPAARVYAVRYLREAPVGYVVALDVDHFSEPFVYVYEMSGPDTSVRYATKAEVAFLGDGS